ncbi:MAG: hypothetical protein FJZ87_04325 [Chloroflexi bacterium]|nr:hypothetical protein [Chloroflexota bacterium]
MKGTGAGWDSILYRVFVLGGILFIVGSTVYTALTQPDGSQIPLYVGIGSVAVFMVLLVGYWIVQILFKGYGAIKAPDLTQKPDLNDLSILSSWNKLFEALVIEGGDPEELKQSARRGNSSLVIWFLWAAVIALCPIALMVPYALGLLDWSYIRYGVMLYLGTIVLMMFVTYALGSKAAQAGEEVLLAPLGLELSATPSVTAGGSGAVVRGETVMNGTRFGRPLRITIQPARVSTEVGYAGLSFSITSRAGDLEAERGAPASVHNVLRRLRKAKRWESLKIHADGRQISAVRDSKGQNMWLYDLWLIERIIEQAEHGGKL